MSYERPSFATRCPEQDITYVKGFALPPPTRRAYGHALASTAKLMLNKQDTRQVFETVTALAGDVFHSLFPRFVETDYGYRVVSEPINIAQILGNRDRLSSFGEGTLAQAYLDFMEGENLTQEGLEQSAAEAGIDFECETQFEELRRMMMHLQVVHDLWHVLTGYGCDAPGEIALLVFTHRQIGHEGFRFIARIGALAAKGEGSSVPMLKIMKEAARRGEQAKFLLGEDVEMLLAMSLEEARAHLGIAPAPSYDGVPVALKNKVLQPRIKKTQAEREAAASTIASA